VYTADSNHQKNLCKHNKNQCILNRNENYLVRQLTIMVKHDLQTGHQMTNHKGLESYERKKTVATVETMVELNIPQHEME
jgi:hypothetical protein